MDKKKIESNIITISIQSGKNEKEREKIAIKSFFNTGNIVKPNYGK